MLFYGSEVIDKLKSYVDEKKKIVIDFHFYKGISKYIEKNKKVAQLYGYFRYCLYDVVRYLVENKGYNFIFPDDCFHYYKASDFHETLEIVNKLTISKKSASLNSQVLSWIPKKRDTYMASGYCELGFFARIWRSIVVSLQKTFFNTSIKISPEEITDLLSSGYKLNSLHFEEQSKSKKLNQLLGIMAYLKENKEFLPEAKRK